MLRRPMRRAMRTWFDVQDHLHRLPPERNHRIETSEVEVILNEVLRNLTEVFVSRQRTEPADPRQR